MSNLFNYDVNLQPAVMDIRSETLEPISSSTHRYVFRLDQAGQLDANSVLLFKPILNQQVAANQLAEAEHLCRVNPHGGGLMAIKRATLQVGDYVLNDIMDIGRVSNLVDMGAVNQSTNSRYNGHYFKNNIRYKVLDNGGTVGTANAGLSESKHGGAGSIVYDRHRSAVDFGRVNDGLADNDCRVNNCIITGHTTTSHQIGIPLGNLFPALKGQEIPLFLFQDYRILITIEFETAEKYVNIARKTAFTHIANNQSMIAPANLVVPAEVKLQVDYIIYPSEVQNQMRQQTNAQGGLNLSFPDIIKVEKQIPQNLDGTGAIGTSGEASPQAIEHRIGMDNKEVHKIYMMKKLIRADLDYKDRIYLNARCDAMNQEEYNVNIDGVDIFQEAKWSPSSQYDETSYCLGGDLQVPRPVYFCDENTIMSRIADEEGGILGKVKPLCLDLANGNAGVVGAGRSIGAYPIIWKYKRYPAFNIANNSTAGGGSNGNLITSKMGALDVDYFVYCSRTANITSTPSGTSVTVAY